MALTDKLSNIAEAIRSKTGKSEEMTLDEMPVEIEGISGGSLDIHGVIEQYRVNAGKSVNAGDFVEFVHKFGAGEFTGEINHLSACKLDDTRILVAYSDITNSNYGTAQILTITNGSVDIGEKTVFHKETTKQICVNLIDYNKVLLSYVRVPYAQWAMAMILTVEDAIITPSSKKAEFSVTTNNQVKHVYGMTNVVISNNKALIAYTWTEAGSSYYNYIHLVSIDGDIITTETSNRLENKIYDIKMTKLTNASVLMLYNYSSSALKARIISISEDTLSRGTEYTICSGDSDYFSTAIFSDSSALIAYRDASNSNYGTAAILKINGMKITIGPSIVFYSGSVGHIEVSTISENKALITYYGSARIITYDGTSLTLGPSTIFFEGTTSGTTNGTYKSIIPFSESSSLVLGVTNEVGKYANLNIDGYRVSITEASGTVVQRAMSRVYNVGIAATSGADGETIDVYTVSLPYPVTINTNNVTLAQSITSLSRFEPSTIAFVPNSGYELNNVIVSGCDYILDESINKITLFNPTEKVTITIDATLLFKGDYSTAETSAGTELTSTIDCNIGDLIVAAIATRDTLTLSDGWTLVSTSEINSADTAGNGQRLSWAWKIAENTTESITVTQASEQRLYINMVALTGATGVMDNGYFYVDDASATSITVNKPDGLVLWGLTNPFGSTGNQWTSTNDIPIVQLGTDTCARLAIGLDQTNETSVTFAPGSSGTTMTVGCLTVQGMEKFY